MTQRLCLPASSWRQQTGLPPYTPQSHFLIRWCFLPPPQSLPTFQTFIKYKTPGLYDRTLHSTYAEKRVRHSNVQKSPVPPALASCPVPNPTAPSPPWSIRGAGAPSPMEGHRAPALHGPGLSCLQPTCPWPGSGKADKGRPQEDSLPTRGGLHQPPPRDAGGFKSALFPPPKGGGQVRAGAGRGCTHTQHLPLGKGDGIQLPSSQPWGN